MVHLVDDWTADLMVAALDAEAQRCRRLAEASQNRGPRFKARRAILRERADECERAISGINTGEGVTRRSAT